MLYAIIPLEKDGRIIIDEHKYYLNKDCKKSVKEDQELINEELEKSKKFLLYYRTFKMSKPKQRLAHQH